MFGIWSALPLWGGAPVHLPFVMDARGHILVQVPMQLNDGRRIMVQAAVDTGASDSLLDPSLLRAGEVVVANESVEFMDAAGKTKVVKMARSAGQWLLPDAPPGLGPRVLDLLLHQKPGANRVVGILGLDVLSHTRLGIDFEHRELVFGDADSYPIEMPLTQVDGSIYVKAPIRLPNAGPGQPLVLKFMLDTGQGNAISLPESYAAHFQGNIYWEDGFTPALGAPINCKVFPQASIRIGDFWIGPREAWVGGKTVEPSLGTSLFTHYKIQLDFDHKKFRMKTYSHQGRALPW